MKYPIRFFVPLSKGDTSLGDRLELPERIDLEWIAVGKHLGLSFDEMAVMRIQDVAALADITVKKRESATKPTVRKATQADIDRLLA